MSDLARFVLFLVLMSLGTAWLLNVAAPVLIDLPATWANAPLLLVAAPAFLLYVLGFITAIRR